MLYSIENKKIKITVTDLGAEMTSLILKKTGVEYLWQADPTYWTGHAYNLFPICGRLWEGKYTYQGKTYEMNLHGFARKTNYEMIEQTENSLTFRLTDSDETYAQYPFHFDLLLTYTLDGASVITTFHVTNKDEKDLIFALGGHPGFNLPLADGETFEDYSLSFSEKCEPKQLCMSETCYFLGETKPFKVRCGKSFPLTHDLFDNDAVFLTDIAPEVTLKSSVSKRFVKVTYPGMKYVGFWHKPKTEAPYVCIEPWTSIPADDGKIDDFETKRDMLKLAAGGEHEQSFTITIG
ncbi:MAG: aldose 1-epimerase family protein [Ruminococcaceae bacterium]|nr:aldose 1-epimerase family protein [Oscillospiraceae bacterium]